MPSTNGALPHHSVADDDLQATPAAGGGEVVKDHRHLGPGATCITFHGLNGAEPPSEGAALLHLPLELEPLPDFQVWDTLQHAIAIQLRCLRRHQLGLQRPCRGRAEAQPVAFVVGDLLGQDLACADIFCNVAIDVRIPRHLRQHAGHGKAQLLLSVVGLEHRLKLASKSVPVHRLPIDFGTAEVGDIFLSFVEGRPAIRIHRFPLFGAIGRGAVANPSRGEVTKPGHICRFLQEAHDVHHGGQSQNGMCQVQPGCICSLDLEVCLVQEQMSPQHAVTKLGADGGIQPPLKARTGLTQVAGPLPVVHLDELRAFG
mmetsp:Transcript_2802/g.5784  ORF Transcript_2802/g.5784 Transcript_2802/m.5784 type:complete len:315 (+) Transcript_2802:303-1247(+)